MTEKREDRLNTRARANGSVQACRGRGGGGVVELIGTNSREEGRMSWVCSDGAAAAAAAEIIGINSDDDGRERRSSGYRRP